jgi:hypothetical protein
MAARDGMILIVVVAVKLDQISFSISVLTKH